MDILISGAGIAGFTLAYWLKQHGINPTVIEKHPFQRKGGYKVDVRGAALEVAKRMGIYQDLLDANVNIKKAQFVTADFKIFHFEGDILGHCSEGDIEINRWDLSQILSKAAGDLEIIYDDSIVKIDELVHFEKMSPRKFDLVLGADGLYSKVRKLAFGADSNYLRDYGVHFCVFPIPKIFELERAEIVYFDKGRLVSAYAVNDNSLACLAFKPENADFQSHNLKEVFEDQFKNIGWEIQHLVDAMKESNECYFDKTAQIRMSSWTKGRVALVGDAAYAAAGIGTSLAMVGAYVLACEIGKSNGDYTSAFNNYEKKIRKFIENGQSVAESGVEIIAKSHSSWLIKCQLYVMQMLPGAFLRLFTKWGRWKMKRAANSIQLD